jgi:hypothetical protein
MFWSRVVLGEDLQEEQQHVGELAARAGAGLSASAQAQAEAAALRKVTIRLRTALSGGKMGRREVSGRIEMELDGSVGSMHADSLTVDGRGRGYVCSASSARKCSA